VLGATTNDDSLHGNIALERRDDIGSLFLLVPTDESVEHENGNDDPEVNPILKTGSKQDSKLHNYTKRSVLRFHKQRARLPRNVP